ncbi:MAG: single-stranded-DNA-specific exonuclease RecJ [Clostridia bacterium]|nr:single-stranded-DNA-specific exonuclease RecJ [Clostridia bacterium]
MILKQWEVGKPEKETAKYLSEEIGLDPFAALIACGRGLTDVYEAEQFFSNELLLSDPREFADIEHAADVINSAIANGEKIAVYGDYDCDGVTATALLTDYLKNRNASVIAYIPNRFSDGYGMSRNGIDILQEQGVQLIITVDNGISCADEVSYANQRGMKVVVTDHHIPPDTLPPAEAVVDPFRRDCPSSFKDICGVAVAFQLVCVLDHAEPEEILPRYADLLAIGTIGDLMPLRQDNRCFVRYGLERLKHAPRVGISALINVAGIERNSLNAGKISFGIVPRINAAGRMGSADLALALFHETDMRKALTLANQLDEQNNERRKLEQEISAEAICRIDEHGYQYHRVIVVSGKDWHQGTIGIVASRIVETYGKPAIVFSESGEQSKGSGRSFSGFSLYDAIANCASVLDGFGGHEMAAGMQIQTEKIDLFRQKINEYAASLDFPIPSLRLDLKLTAAALTLDTAAAITALEPFGLGNPTPVFGVFDVCLEKIIPIGNEKHLRLSFTKSGATFEAVMFSVTPGQFGFSPGDRLDLAVTLSINLFRGEEKLTVQIKDLRPAELQQDKLFREYAAYHDCISGYKSTTCPIPSRQESVEIYRMILKGPIAEQQLLWRFIPTLGYCKTAVTLQAFRELGFITVKDGFVHIVPGAVKSDLMSAPVFKKIKMREVSELDG